MRPTKEAAAELDRRTTRDAIDDGHKQDFLRRRMPPRGTFHGTVQRALSRSPKEVARQGVPFALLCGRGGLPLRWRSRNSWRVIVHLRPSKKSVRECRGAGLGWRVQRASSSSSQYASALYFMGAATGSVSGGSAQNMRTDSAKAKVSRQLATGRRRSAWEPRRGMPCCRPAAGVAQDLHAGRRSSGRSRREKRYQICTERGVQRTLA